MTKLNIDVLFENIWHYFNVHNSNSVKISLERKSSGMGVPELNQLRQKAIIFNYELAIKTELPERAINGPVYGMNNEDGVVYHLNFKKEKNK